MQQVNTWAKYLVQLVIPCITGTIIGWDGITIIYFNFAKDTGTRTVACLSLVSTDDSTSQLTQSHSQDY